MLRILYPKFTVKTFELFCIEPGLACGSRVGTRLAPPWSLRLRTLTPSTEGAKKVSWSPVGCIFVHASYCLYGALHHENHLYHYRYMHPRPHAAP
ncbi:hypothetical protein J3E68DRAFT_389876 [Trichoderma sp. SZMC 28012]